MSKRIEIINEFYNHSDEDTRLNDSRHGMLEYATTMNYINKYITDKTKILEIGAGTGRYSISLAKKGCDVTAVDLVESNLLVLKQNSSNLNNIHTFQSDALDLSRFCNNEFDITLVLGPLYHLYSKDDVNKAIDEAIRVTKNNGVIFIAFLSVYSIIFNNYLEGNLFSGLEENFTDDFCTKHFEEQLFTGYDILEFENLFTNKNVLHITTVSTDSAIEIAEERKCFKMSDEEFNAFLKLHLSTCEKRELLGFTSHLLYICKKK